VAVTVDCVCGSDGGNEKDWYIILREKQKWEDFEKKKRIAIRIHGR
jgi:hypothetical protein